MNRNVEITVSGIQDDGGGDKTETCCRTIGQYFERNGCRYLLYEEQDADSEACTSNTVKLSGNILELSRKGNIHSRMVFEAGRTHSAEYVTPYGTLQLQISTDDLKCLWTDAEARIRITYRLLTADGFLSRNKLVIKIRNISSED